MSESNARTISADELGTHRPVLVKFAMQQLRNPAQAEDAVQETLVAAIRGLDRFAGGSSARTWLIGILKHKIIDIIRSSKRELPLELDESDTSLADLEPMFKEDGHYVSQPADWGDPDQALQRSQFFEVMGQCMEGLPKNTARVFMMRDVMELDNDDICRQLGISSGNCWVMLHRARMRMRECLELKWFARG